MGVVGNQRVSAPPSGTVLRAEVLHELVRARGGVHLGRASGGDQGTGALILCKAAAYGA